MKLHLNNMASFPFGLKIWYNIICYKRKYSFSHNLRCAKIWMCKKERERTKWSFPAFFCRNCSVSEEQNNTIHANSTWFSYLFVDKNSNVLFGANFPSLSLSLSLSLPLIPLKIGLVELPMYCVDQDFLVTYFLCDKTS